MQLEQMETGRLIIRSTRESDGDNCLDIWLDDEMGKYMGDPPRDKADEGTLNFAVGIENDDGWYPMVIIHKETKEFLGTSSIVPSVDGKVWDLGYAVHKKFWRQGYATEFLGRIIELGRQNGISAFTAKVAKENAPSCELLKKLGFIIVQDSNSFRKRGTDIVFPEYTFKLKIV